MIYIFHGEDSKSSYARQNELLKSYSDFQIINLSGKDTTRAILIESLHGQSLFDEKEIIVGQNLIKNKVAEAQDLNALANDRVIILWEDAQLTATQLSKFKSFAKIEIFKLPTQLFAFLDSIVPNSNRPFLLLQKLKAEGQEHLCYLLSNRFFLLLLAKKGLEFNEAQELTAKVTKSRLLDWQWQKIKNQAYPYDMNTLSALFSGVLKIDHMQKSGSTNLDSTTLISMLFLKYLKPQKNVTISTTAHGRYSMV